MRMVENAFCQSLADPQNPTRHNLNVRKRSPPQPHMTPSHAQGRRAASARNHRKQIQKSHRRQAEFFHRGLGLPCRARQGKHPPGKIGRAARKPSLATASPRTVPTHSAAAPPPAAARRPARRRGTAGVTLASAAGRRRGATLRSPGEDFRPAPQDGVSGRAAFYPDGPLPGGGGSAVRARPWPIDGWDSGGSSWLERLEPGALHHPHHTPGGSTG